MTDLITVRLRVRGRVQGVWYRGSTAERATELGVSGWVRNRTDGSVEAVAQGRREAVDALVRWCRRGPELARVDSLEVVEIGAEGDGAEPLVGFSVRRG